MPTTLAPVIKFRWFDGDGEPLNGGKVFTYVAGTATPLSTYSDYAGTVPNTNPVILDSEGYADIRLGEGLLYKFVITDANNVTLITTDNVGNIVGGGGGGDTNGGFGEPQNVASATVIDLGPVASHFANITGTTTINSFGINALTETPIYLLKFESSLTLTNGSTLLLPGSKDIVTQQNDRALVEFLGSGIWRVWAYERATGNPLWLDNINVTGTITSTGAITGVGSLTINGTAVSAASVVLGEDTDNGTNTVTVMAPSAIASNKTQTLQDVSDMIAVLGDVRLRILQTINASNAGNITFDSTVITSTYKRYFIEIIDAVVATDGAMPQVLLSVNNGSSYLSSYRMFYIYANSNGTGQSNGANAAFAYIPASGAIAGQGVGNAAGEGLNGRITLNNMSGSQFKSVHVSTDYTTADGYAAYFDGTGQSNVTTVVNNVRIVMSAGNITSGTFVLYGLL